MCPQKCAFAVMTSATLFGGSAFAEEPPSQDAVFRYHSVEVRLQSWRPEEPLTSYRSYGPGSCSGGGAVGLGASTAEGGFVANVKCRPDPKRFLVELRVVPSEADETTEALDKQFDLTDLKPVTLELARDEDGRTYRLTLIPSVVEKEPPKTFDPLSLQLRSWDFQSSPVILNDRIYVGQMGMSGGTLAGIDISGVARCEFSLLPLKDGKPTGVLQDGVLHLQGDDVSIMISNVRNGEKPQMLEGGPFTVWVRWFEPEERTQATKEIIRSQIELLERRRDAGDRSVSETDIQQLREYLRGKPIVLGSSARDVRPNEIAKPEENGEK